jgi:hypothetical protein
LMAAWPARFAVTASVTHHGKARWIRLSFAGRLSFQVSRRARGIAGLRREQFCATLMLELKPTAWGGHYPPTGRRSRSSETEAPPFAGRETGQRRPNPAQNPCKGIMAQALIPLKRRILQPGGAYDARAPLVWAQEAPLPHPQSKAPLPAAHLSVAGSRVLRTGGRLALRSTAGSLRK